MKLNEIADNAGARKIRKRVGQPGFGLGKTGGRGARADGPQGGAKAGSKVPEPIYRGCQRGSTSRTRFRQRSQSQDRSGGSDARS